MNNIKDSMRDSKTIVIDSVQLRDKGPTPDRPLLEREPVLEPVNISIKGGESVRKSELKMGVGNNELTGIVTAYLKNNLVEISDEQITIKNGSNPLYKIYLEGTDLHINDDFVLNSSGQVKKMLISDDMIVKDIPSNTDSYSNGQLLFVKGS